ncbi:MAG: DUF1611 domain-containing protein [Candidatus Melainabacteria bacterium]|nr:DUF1611 domain-containing protein [Candidatus Melainabacteria bacterium]
MQVDTSKRLILYARDEFGGGHSKTAEGVIRFGKSPIVAVVDRQHAGKTAKEVCGAGENIPIVATIEEAAKLGGEAMLLGCAFVGGRMPEAWRQDILKALDLKMDVINGLHDFLVEDEEFLASAKRNGKQLIDLRKPPDNMPIANGRARALDAMTVLAVGSDISIGKMTLAIELDRLATRRGYKSGFVATGQTGIMIAGSGVPLDRVIGDFMAGVIEELVLEAAPGLDMLFVEGQGSVYHPGYSGVTMSLVHGAAPEVMIMCHKAGRDSTEGKGEFPLPDLNEMIRMYEQIAGIVRPAKVVGVCINTSKLSESEARKVVDQAAQLTGLPATDPVRFGADNLMDALEVVFKSRKTTAVQAK